MLVHHIILQKGLIMQNCEFIIFISTLACSIAKDKTPEEIGVLSAFFVQLRRHFGNHHCFRRKPGQMLKNSALLCIHIQIIKISNNMRFL